MQLSLPYVDHQLAIQHQIIYKFHSHQVCHTYDATSLYSNLAQTHHVVHHVESPTTNVSSLTLSPPDNTSSNLFLTSTLAGRTIFAYALLPLTNSHPAVSLTTPPPLPHLPYPRPPSSVWTPLTLRQPSYLRSLPARSGRSHTP